MPRRDEEDHVECGLDAGGHSGRDHRLLAGLHLGDQQPEDHGELQELRDPVGRSTRVLLKQPLLGCENRPRTMILEAFR